MFVAGKPTLVKSCWPLGTRIKQFWKKENFVPTFFQVCLCLYTSRTQTTSLTATHGRCSTLHLSREHSRGLLSYLPHLSSGDPGSSMVTPLVGGVVALAWCGETTCFPGEGGPAVVMETPLLHLWGGWIWTAKCVQWDGSLGRQLCRKEELCWERFGLYFYYSALYGVSVSCTRRALV